MALINHKTNELQALTPEAILRLNSLANLNDNEIDYSDNPALTETELACAVRVSDYPTEEDANNEADYLMEMHKNGMSLEEIQIYKRSRIKQLTTTA